MGRYRGIKEVLIQHSIIQSQLNFRDISGASLAHKADAAAWVQV